MIPTDEIRWSAEQRFSAVKGERCEQMLALKRQKRMQSDGQGSQTSSGGLF